ncbi:MAG TPA: hypothetical protein VMT88_05560 [Actinomycetes bacterium]|nr:hypothetical protein [Actinomycetes bacterium]
MTARRVVIVLVAACAVYLVLIAQRSWTLITSARPLGVVMGAALMVLPLIGAWVLYREVQFGLRTSELAKLLAADGLLPVDDLPRRPSGRPERAAADQRFAVVKSGVENDPGQWQKWYLLGLAYDDAGDRRRAREAMRRAVALHAAEGS